MPLLLFPLPPLSPLPHPLDETVLYMARYANQCSHHIGQVVHSGLVQVCGRDGGICRITGVAYRKYWEGRQANVGFGVFKACEVAHGIPWSVGQSVRDTSSIHSFAS